MQMKTKGFLVSIFILCIFTIQLQAKQTFMDVEAGIASSLGNSTYQIGWFMTLPDGQSGIIPWGKISELMFPVNVFNVYANLRFNFTKTDTLQIYAIKSITADSGKMEDSDWLHSAGQKDVFSTSTTKMDAFMIDGDYVWSPFTFFDMLTLGFGGGFLYNQFGFECSDTAQTQTGFGTVTIKGKTITYDVKYYMPYMEAVGKASFTDSLNASLAIGFSPIAMASDLDHHIVRSKKQSGFGTGTGWKIALNMRWFIVENLSLSLDGKFYSVSISGEGNQSTDAGTALGTIDEKIFLSQFILGLNLGYSF
jgi:outer membrane protease